MKTVSFCIGIGGICALMFVNACSISDDPLVVKAGRTRLSAKLQPYQSCAQLETELKSHFKEELRNRLLMLKDQGVYGYPVLGGVKEGDSSNTQTPTSAAGAPRVEGVDYSGTNNQEAGVDEADFVKTDGFFIYIVNGDLLEILGTPQAGQATYLSSLKIEGAPSQMLQFGDRLAIFSYAQSFGIVGPAVPAIAVASSSIWFSQRTKITMVKLDAERKNPTIEKEWYFDGSFIAARKIQNKIFAASSYAPIIKDVVEYPVLNLPQGFDYSDQAALKAAWEAAIVKAIADNDAAIDRATLNDLVPHFYTKSNNDFVPQSLSEGDCQNFSKPEDSVARTFSSILTIDLASTDVSPQAVHILSNYPQLYASATTLILAEPAEDAWWFYGNPNIDEATNIHRFSVSAEGATAYTGSGRIDGSILNQFSLSEYNGYVRAVSTTGRFNRWFMPEAERRDSENHVFVLGGDNALSVVGKIDGIAKGERIWSSRFVNDKAYLVTFKNVDPLFTIDLADPANPRIVGQLKVPGVSTYIHPLDGGFLLNVGFGGDSTNIDWTTNIALYNVNDFSNPLQFDVLSFAPTTGSQTDRWVWVSSEANYEHKAITYWAPKAILAIPISTYRNSFKGDGNFSYEYVSKLELVHAKAGESLSVVGEVDHSEFFNTPTQTYFFNPEIRRSIFMDDFVYAISQKGVTANRLSGMQRTATVPLKGITSVLIK